VARAIENNQNTQELIMAQKIIAFFQTREQAERAEDDLESAGFADHDVHVFSKSGNSFWQDVKEAFGFASAEDQYLYDEAARRGAVALVVNVDQDDDDAPSQQTAVQILQRHNPMDLDVQAQQWRQEGWRGGATAADTQTNATARTDVTATTAAAHLRQDQPARTTAGTGEQVIPVVQENVEIGKRAIQRGGIRVHTRVTERPVEREVELRSERATVERRPVDRPIGDADRAFQDRTVEVTERAEQAVVNKTARVVEEVVVGKQVEQHTQTVRDTERRTDVDVEKLNPDQGGGSSMAFNPDTFASEIARDQRYRGRDWSAIETDARSSFEQRYPGSRWEQFKDSIRSGYDRMRAKV